MGTHRMVIHIDEGKCDGCGRCVIACAEGAIEIRNGKARLVSDAYCDGLGICIGECPRGAIALEAGTSMAAEQTSRPGRVGRRSGRAEAGPIAIPPPSGVHTSARSAPAPARAALHPTPPSGPTNWPIRMKLVPPNAPYFERAKVLVAADCAPFVLPDFHKRFVPGRVVLAGCPQLDDAWFCRAKLAQVFSPNEIEQIHIVYMDVPCCAGLVRIVRGALRDARREIPVSVTNVSIHGEVKATEPAGEADEQPEVRRARPAVQG